MMGRKCSARLKEPDKNMEKVKCKQRGPNVFSTMSSKFCVHFACECWGGGKEERIGESRGGRAAGEGGVGGFRRNADRLY